MCWVCDSFAIRLGELKGGKKHKEEENSAKTLGQKVSQRKSLAKS